ncbi:pimeloyl-ACP methyl ester carboxylesterase [Kribbella pratensis]|uniref:Pimeloyl-ACP methyl ester carboxylesterase n=1 Tax=Kribbella pratensis TaxID=2512112 RepID=A0ABY2FN21_9ACTN|nr:alpha/beta hydrolase [Kribbella pratensis]TDW94533.1 pimeloyl-ACP methyl ester carboxylesterase [Kribbella pratensis]
MQKLVSVGLQTIGVLSPRLGGRLAFNLWRRPLTRGRVRPNEQIVHNAARVEIVDNVKTYAWGDGNRPVLLVHGWRSRASRYAAFITRLLELGYSPVSYDAPAHGDSDGDVVSILGHQRIIRGLEERHGPFEGVIAHSLGVPFALYAVREGVAAKRLVMISGVADFGYLADTFCAQLGLGPKINQQLRRRIERGYFDGDDQIWKRFSVTTGKLELLVIHNDEDEIVDPAQAQVLLRNYGDRAHFLPTTGLGHRKILSDPAVIAEAVAFLQDSDVHSDVHSDVAEGLDLSA